MRGAYNAASLSYRSSADEGAYYHRHVEMLRTRVALGSTIVDLGCGCGVPLARDLSAYYKVLGVDISDTQLYRAARLVPAATLVQADLDQFELRPMSVGGVVALFSIIHMPLTAQRRLIDRVAEWLKPGGTFMFVGGGASAWNGSKQDWHGVEMRWCQAAAADYVRWVAQAGLRLEACEVSDRGERGHSLLVCRRET